MPVFAVHYDYADDSEESRNVHRPAHREFLGTLTGPVKALATGPYADPPAAALLVIEADSADAVESKLDEDPFFVNGLIKRRQIREWTQVNGPWAN
jgi:uncharacterized protein YciI